MLLLAWGGYRIFFNSSHSTQDNNKERDGVLLPLVKHYALPADSCNDKSEFNHPATNIKKKFSSLKNFIQISTTPSGAVVNINQLFSARTPFTWKEPAAGGKLHCKIQLEGYRPLDTIVDYNEGVRRLQFNLQPSITETSGGSTTGTNFTFTVLKHSSSLRNIYENRLIETPDLSGKVTVEIIVSSTGEVLKCSIIKTDITDTQFLSTLVDNIHTWNFEKTNSDEPATFTYTFPFNP